MKIRIQGFENEIVFDDESVNILQISNKILLQNIMEKIFQSTKENTLEIQLISNENETLKFQDNVFFVTDLYNLNINTKAVTSKISEYISESFMLDESKKIERNIHDIEEILLEKLCDLSFEVTIKNEIEIPDIVKLFGIKINTEEYVNILNRLELLISILARFTEVKILIIANLKNILNNEQIIEFYKMSLYNGINILLIESEQHEKLKYEKILEIDENFNDFII